MASVQVGEICYPTPEAGALAAAARFVLAPQTISSGCVGVPYASGSGASLVVQWQRISGSCSMPAATTYSPVLPDCQQYGISDAASMAWGVAACWIGVFAVAVILKRALS